MRTMKAECLAVVAALLVAGAAQADAIDDALVAVGYKAVPCRVHNADQERADHDLAQAALEKLNARDTAAVESMTSDLRAALSRAPDVPALPEHCGDELHIYSDQTFALLEASAVLSKSPALAGMSAVQFGEEPYSHIAFILGWMAYEQRNYDGALRDYGRGLKNDPDNVTLASEYASTLSALGRAEDASVYSKGFLAAHPALAKADRALMLRRSGYALIDLARWDEAEAAYKESLELEPGNAVAKNDLDYIAENRNKH